MAQYNRLSIKDWSLEDRPREKLQYKGARLLTNAELLAIIIGSGNTNETAVELSKRILSASNNDLNLLAKLSVNDLMRFKGIGEAKAVNIIAAMEIGRRRKGTNLQKPKAIKSSGDAMEIFIPMLSDLEHEEFWVIYLDRANQVKDSQQISKGGISGTIVDVRLILKRAIELSISAIILGHNHPSGNLNPSDSDISITQKVVNAAKVMDIAVLDHIIIAGRGYYSFADNNLI